MNITKQDVLAVAADLINQNGSTTTKEVKEALRKNGFTARQVEVSSFMDELAKIDDELAILSDNGTYRTYGAIPSTLQPVFASASSTATQATGILTTPLNAAVKGCWEVNAAVRSSVVMYFDSNMTRDAVRQAYAKATGIKFADTRSRIYK